MDPSDYSSNEEVDERLALYDAVNDTELRQLCLRVGLRPHPDTNREELIRILLDEVTHSTNPIDEWRNGLIAFIKKYWTRMKPQLTCPAKDLESKNPEPCYGCSDIRVLACVVEQPRHKQTIGDLKKK